MSELQSLIYPLLELCEQAGEAICKHYHSAEADVFEPKGDDTPLTRADLDSHAILSAGLESLQLRAPVLSEESKSISLAQRLSWSRYWLVDPLDGTREFLDRTGEFTINIALINQHEPEFGMLYLPLERRAYVGIPGQLAQRYEQGDGGVWHEVVIDTRALQPQSGLTVLASHRHRGPRLGQCINWLEERCGMVERRNSGSALKFCQLVDGEGDFYPRFSPCCEWDTAAGHAVLLAAGGNLIGLDGRPVRYNTSESLYSPDFYALADPDHTLWQEMLEARF